MSKKAKAEVEVADESAVIITDAVLAKNNMINCIICTVSRRMSATG